MLVSAYVLSEFKTRADGCTVGFIDLCRLLVGEIREKGLWMSSGSLHWFSYSAFVQQKERLSQTSLANLKVNLNLQDRKLTSLKHPSYKAEKTLK